MIQSTFNAYWKHYHNKVTAGFEWFVIGSLVRHPRVNAHLNFKDFKVSSVVYVGILEDAGRLQRCQLMAPLSPPQIFISLTPRRKCLHERAHVWNCSNFFFLFISPFLFNSWLLFISFSFFLFFFILFRIRIFLDLVINIAVASYKKPGASLLLLSCNVSVSLSLSLSLCLFLFK